MRYNFNKFVDRVPTKGIDLFRRISNKICAKENGPWICGGAIRRLISNQELDSDVDIFFKSESQRKEVKKLLGATRRKISENDMNETYMVKIELEEGREIEIKVQLIFINYYKTVEAVLDSFDFTICQFGYDGKDLICGEYSLWDLGRKKLAINEITYGVSTLRRLIKYTRQGFTACGGVLADMLERVIDNPDIINAEFEYID